jgi:hypothetical protein
MNTAWRASLLCLLSIVSLAAFGGTKSWTGSGGNALWSNGANWSDGASPVNGDDLVFAGQSTTNDLANLSLSSITVTAGSPAFSGQFTSVAALRVTGGAMSLTSSPFWITTSATIAGGTLKLEQSLLGNASTDSGTIEVTSDKGRSNATGLSLGPGARFAVDLSAPVGAPAVDYLVVHGNISLGGSTLVLANTGPLAATQIHTLIRNEGPNPVSGTFRGLPEGTTIVQGMAYRISYHGGSSGRDVTLLMLAASRTTLSSTHSPMNFGGLLTLTADVHGGAWLGKTPTGLVELFDGVTSLGTVPLSGGTAVLATRALLPGSHSLTAAYPGADIFGPHTSPPLVVVVQQAQAPTDTTLSGAPPPAFSGQRVFTALVHAEGLIPAGDVTFFDGPTSLATLPVDGTGKATLQTTLPDGKHSVSATFNGSPNYHPSTSNALTETVETVVPTQTTLSASLHSAKAGAPITLRATVVSFGGSPQGIVNFLEGSTLLGTANVESDQIASLTLTTLTAGDHSLTAFYVGGGRFSASTSAALDQHIDAAQSDCAPVIVTPPLDTALSTRGTATLMVGTLGGEREAFQWYLGSYPDTSRPVGSAAMATITDTWTSTDVWVLVTNGCGTAHATAHLTAFVPARRRTASH